MYFYDHQTIKHEQQERIAKATSARRSSQIPGQARTVRAAGYRGAIDRQAAVMHGHLRQVPRFIAGLTRGIWRHV